MERTTPQTCPAASDRARCQRDKPRNGLRCVFPTRPIELHATLRPEAKAVIEGLKKRGLSLSIISGDQAEPTRKLAGELGIDTYFADTLPENKAKIIRQLQEQGRVVCFVGDGINDAIALKQADVSVSLKGATTLATDTAQVVLMDQSLNQLDTLFSLARQYDKTMTLGLWTTVVPGGRLHSRGVFCRLWHLRGGNIIPTGFFQRFGRGDEAVVDSRQSPCRNK